MDRRKFLIGTAGTALGGSAILGSGAFSRVESQRDVTIEVARDPDAYLGLSGTGSENSDNYVSIDDHGHLAIDIGENDNDGEGVNSDSFTWFDSMVQVCNQGKEGVGFYIVEPEDDDFPEGVDAEDDEGRPRLQFYTGEAAGSQGDDGTDSVMGQENAVDIPLGECIELGVRTNTKGVDASDDGPGQLFGDEVTLIADVDVAGDLERQEDRVRNLQTREGFDSIQAAIDAANEGDTVEVQTSETFEEDIRIDVADLTLRASNSNDPTIVGQETTDAVVNVDEPGVTVENIAIEAPDMQAIDHNSGAPGLDVLGVSIEQTGDEDPSVINLADDDVLIQDADIDAGGTGVFIQQDNDNIKLRDSEIAGATTAITVQSPGVVIANNVIQDAEGGNEVGVTLTTGGTADDAEVVGNEFENLGTGVFVGPNDDVTVEDNEFADNDFHLNVDAEAEDFQRSDNEFDRAVETEDATLEPLGFDIDLQLSIAPDIGTVLTVAEEDATVEVGEGEYEEDVEIDTDGLTLESTEGAEETTIAGSVDINADDVAVEDLTIEDEGFGSTLFVEGGGVDVTDNVIVNSEDGGGIGVELAQDFSGFDAPDGVDVIDNEVVGEGQSGQGVVLDATSEGTLVDENLIRDVDTGIKAFQAFDDPNDGEIGEDNEFENVNTEISDLRDD